MAIDTETKRRSAQADVAGTIRPVADGTIGTADRAHCAWMYSGLTYAAPDAAVIRASVRRGSGRLLGWLQTFMPAGEST